MEKGFKPQANCQRRVDSGVLDPSSVRSRAGDTNAVSSSKNSAGASRLLDKNS
jgi:hypothetical protein